MNDALESLEPRLLWSYFRELSNIPRGSGHEAAAAAWVAEQGRRLGGEVSQDTTGNVLIRQGASPGKAGAPLVALQAHVDMVCEKDEHVAHDFLRDPIALVREGDRLRARGTTLGADNGIGVAAALAVLASREVPHGPLEVLITVDEERGLLGAKRIPAGTLAAKRLLNLDSGKDGILIIGCAGGLDSKAVREVALRPADPEWVPFRLQVAGLRGGHSGGDIDRGRGNAIQLLARALRTLEPFGPGLASLDGGGKRNAIPREASALLCLAPDQESRVRAALADLEGDVREALGAFDPEVTLRLEREGTAPREVLEPQEARRVTAFLLSLPHGVIARSPVMPGLVLTSTNLATVATLGDRVDVRMSHRSALEASKAAIAERIAALCELADFAWTAGESYPGWVPDPGASLVKLACRVHETLFGVPARIHASHGGLECGLLGARHPGLEMISFGPDIRDNHSPSESLGIASVDRFWKLLGAILEAL